MHPPPPEAGRDAAGPGDHYVSRSLSHDIVTLGHRGALTVEGAEGEGTTFTVTLPG